jgi:hypothetical protein
MRVSRWVLLLLLSFAARSADAQIRINEIFINPPGTDNGLEFFELFSNSGNVSLNNLFLIAIEGDGTAAGTVDQVLSLSGLSTGSNGLFMWRDAATTLTPGPDPNTNIFVQDFAPDLENGSTTFLLVNGFTGAINDDLDTDNDGVLDSTPWASVLDGIALIENDGASNFGYADDLGFANFGPFAGFNADVLLRLQDSGIWVGGDVLGSGTGPFTFDPTRFGDINGNLIDPGSFSFNTITPGSFNPVPEPSAMSLCGFCAAGLAFGRRGFRRRSK